MPRSSSPGPRRADSRLRRRAHRHRRVRSPIFDRSSEEARAARATVPAKRLAPSMTGAPLRLALVQRRLRGGGPVMPESMTKRGVTIARVVGMAAEKG